MGGGQMAVVMILGGLLLVYGGATGRLGAAWGALKGGGGSSTPKPEEAPSGEPETPSDPPKGGAIGPQVATVQSVNSTGQLTARPGGFRQ